MAKKKKSSAKKPAQKAAEPVVEEPKKRVDQTASEAPIISSDPTAKDQFWWISSVVIIAVAAFFRFYALALKPFHHDEGVNGFFLTNLVRDGVYKYDPGNYHGPTLYYISLAFSKIFGLNTVSVRLSVTIFGFLTVILAFYLRPYIGRNGSLAAALFLALSPGMTFISRYFIHEMFFVFCSLAIVVAVLLFIEKAKAGIGAIAWMALILYVSLSPPSIILTTKLSGDSTVSLWLFGVLFFLVESVLVYYVMRLLLGWNGGRAIYLILASASAAMLFATKETAFITLGTMAIACLSVWIWRGIANGDLFKKNRRIILAAFHVLLILAAFYYSQGLKDGFEWLQNYFVTNDHTANSFVYFSMIVMALIAVAAWAGYLYFFKEDNAAEYTEPAELKPSVFTQALGSRTDLILITVAVVVAFAYLSALFFSSFFTYAEGISKAFEAYAIWTKTGNKDHTQNGVFGYFKWGMKVESPILILSTLGILITFIKAKHRFAVFAAFWAFGMFAAYSIIPYKTPWLALSFILPMCISAGYGINELTTSKTTQLKIAGFVLAVLGAVTLAYQSYEIDFVRYDDEEMGYVYAHTKREMLDLVDKIGYYAEKSGKGDEATIEIVTPDYWPMTWYMKDYKHANFHGRLVDSTTSEMILAKKKDQDSAVIEKYASHYKFVDKYALRPGVDLILLVRNDLADPGTRELRQIPEAPNSP